MSSHRAGVIGLDWGTSNLRAFLMAEDGSILAQRDRPWGILALPSPADQGGFDAALDGVAGDWLREQPQARLIASGMVGSAQGWREAPYAACPATAADLAARTAVVMTASGRPLVIVPGLLQNADDELPDVIRGEETQVVGALDDGEEGATLYVLPGTHSKWVIVRNGRIERFATYLTGELFGVLRGHSILGRLMPPGPPDGGAAGAAAFSQALMLARDSRPGDLMRHLFTVRSSRLADRLPAGALADYLSGLLIGHEMVSALGTFAATLAGARAMSRCVLIGEPALLVRYQTAFAAFERTAHALTNTAAAGLFRIAALTRS